MTTTLTTLLSSICLITAARAGVVQGAVLEHTSGRPMARTRVRLTPVPKPGDDAKPLAVRAGISGHFIFPAVSPGLYLLTAIREHYFPASYGQRLPHGQGIPIEVTAGSDLFTELRMRRMGAITGRATSDDRGVYRIHGLDPGKYWIRSGGFNLDDGSGFIPTFGPETLESREARIYSVSVDTETPDADLRPIPGSLFRMTVSLQCQPLGAPLQKLIV